MESLTAPCAPMPAVDGAHTAPDNLILSAFAAWQAHHAARQALPDTLERAPGDIFSVEERAAWDAIDRTENEVHDLPALTPAGVACKLWISIPHNTTDAEPGHAAFRADLDWFVAKGGAIDWNLRCIVSALVALKTMEG